jgi:hypothetical protein
MGKGDFVSTKIPRKWQESIEVEQKSLGCDSKAGCLDRILGSYFGQKDGAASDEGKGEVKVTVGNEGTPDAPKETPSAESSQEVTSLARQVGELTASLNGAQREAKRWQEEASAKGTDLQAWQTMEKHAPVPDILEHLASCPNCAPQLQSFLDRYVNTLPPDRVKEVARQQKWWPPPPIELPTRRGRT